MSNAEEFRAGEIVDIVIAGARVLDVTGTHPQTIHFTVATGENVSWSMPLDHQQISVERFAPAEWPPRPGDLWRDKHGELWFVHRIPGDPGSGRLMGRTTNGARWTDDANYLLRDNGPLTLVHREPEGGAS